MARAIKPKNNKSPRFSLFKSKKHKTENNATLTENKNEKKDKIFTKEKKSKLKKIYDDIKLGDD